MRVISTNLRELHAPNLAESSPLVAIVAGVDFVTGFIRREIKTDEKRI